MSNPEQLAKVRQALELEQQKIQQQLLQLQNRTKAYFTKKEEEEEKKRKKQEIRRLKQRSLPTFFKGDFTGLSLQSLGDFVDTSDPQHSSKTSEKKVIFYAFNQAGNRFDMSIGEEFGKLKREYPKHTIVILHLVGAVKPSSDPQQVHEYEGCKVIKFWYNMKLQFHDNPENEQSKQQLQTIILNQ